MAAERCPVDQADLYYPTDHLGRVYARCTRCGRDWTHVQLTPLSPPPQPRTGATRVVKPQARILKYPDDRAVRNRLAEEYVVTRLTGRPRLSVREVAMGAPHTHNVVYRALLRLIDQGQVTRERAPNGLGSGTHMVYSLTPRH